MSRLIRLAAAALPYLLPHGREVSALKMDVKMGEPLLPAPSTDPGATTPQSGATTPKLKFCINLLLRNWVVSALILLIVSNTIVSALFSLRRHGTALQAPLQLDSFSLIPDSNITVTYDNCMGSLSCSYPSHYDNSKGCWQRRWLSIDLFFIDLAWAIFTLTKIPIKTVEPGCIGKLRWTFAILTLYTSPVLGLCILDDIYSSAGLGELVQGKGLHRIWESALCTHISHIQKLRDRRLFMKGFSLGTRAFSFICVQLLWNMCGNSVFSRELVLFLVRQYLPQRLRLLLWNPLVAMIGKGTTERESA